MRERPRAEWPYFIEVGPAVLAVPLDEVKTWLKVSHSDLDAEITALVEGATNAAENLTRRVFIEKTYRTFRDGFSDAELAYGNYAALIPYSRRSGCDLSSIELRKSRLQSIVSVEYLKNAVWTLVDSSVYYNTIESAYSSLLLNDGEAWPTDVDNRRHAVRIDFTAGYGGESSDIPSDIRTAIKMHVANAFTNRGDCMNAKWIPVAAAMTYANNRIMEIGA